MTREEVIEELQYIHDSLVSCELSYEALEIAIKTLSEDVKPVVRGEWELIDAEEPIRYGCSVCKRLSWVMSNYCPNCGARMKGGNDDDQ